MPSHRGVVRIRARPGGGACCVIMYMDGYMIRSMMPKSAKRFSDVIMLQSVESITFHEFGSNDPNSS
jgi:hypothetical protein